MDNPTGLTKQISNEIRDYFSGEVNISEKVNFSQAKLVKRIGLFESKTYLTGKYDSQGNYKYWFDKITPCINAEIKNIDIDTKNFKAKSDRAVDELATYIVNLKIKDWLRDNGQAEKINSAVEEGSSWGNVLWKKVRGTYERCNLKNIYIINQTAENVDETPIIERHEYSQSDLRLKSGLWKNIEEVINECGENSYKLTPETQSKETTVPYYEIYERNGEVCLKDLKDYLGEKIKEGDEKKYTLAKVIVAGLKSNLGVEIKYILYANYLNKKLSDIYKEFHRGRYKGRWWREGLYELLFDIQVRLNQIGNQIAQGLEWTSKVIFQDDERLIVQNILFDMTNGDVIKAKNLRQVEVRMQGFDQLANEWNRLILLANDIANSQEVIVGKALPSGTPLGAYNQLNMNANKLFVFLQEKLAIPFSKIFVEWLIPEMVDDLKAQDIVNLTGNSEILNRVRTMIVDDWYLKNLINLPPHTNEVRDTLKNQKIEELKTRPQLLMSGLKDMFKGFKENVYVDIVGEQNEIAADNQSLVSIINLEADPARRSFLVEKLMKNVGINTGELPKFQPQPTLTKVA